MRIRALHKNARIAPRKVRVLKDVVVGRPAAVVQQELAWHRTMAAALVRDVITSAVANAVHNYSVAADNLVVASMTVDDGFRLKRFQPASRGMAHPFVKRTSHIAIELKEIVKSTEERAGKKTAIETIEAADFVARGDAPEEAAAPVDEAAAPAALTKTPGPDAELAISNKIKTMQQGGDKGKRLRRQDKGGGK